MSTNRKSVVTQTESAGIVQEEVETLVIDLDASAIPSVLGDVRDGAINKIPPSSAFAQLPRPRIKDLPGIHSADSEFGKSPLLAKVEQTYRKIYGGDFTCIATRCVEGSIIKYDIAATIKKPNEDPEGFCVSFGYEQGGEPTRVHHRPASSNDTFYYCLRDHQRRALYLRVTHIFLRTLGTWLDPAAFHFLVNALKARYGKSRWSKEYHDLAIICSDVSLNHDHLSKYGVECLVTLGYSLESLGDWSSASTLYQEILSTYWNPIDDNDGQTSRARLLTLIASALTHAGRYAEAEIFHLHSLRVENAECQRRWEDANEIIVNNVALFYVAWLAFEPGEWVHQSSFPMVFLALFICAETKLRSVQDLLGFCAQDCIKINSSPKKKAQKALSLAISQFNPQTPNVLQFREAILKCSKPTYRSFLAVDEASLLWLRTELNEMKKERSLAKLRASGASGCIEAHLVCGYKPCESVEANRNFKSCPCQTRYYVSIFYFSHPL